MDLSFLKDTRIRRGHHGPKQGKPKRKRTLMRQLKRKKGKKAVEEVKAKPKKKLKPSEPSFVRVKQKQPPAARPSRFFDLLEAQEGKTEDEELKYYSRLLGLSSKKKEAQDQVTKSKEKLRKELDDDGLGDLDDLLDGIQAKLQADAPVEEGDDDEQEESEQEESEQEESEQEESEQEESEQEESEQEDNIEPTPTPQKYVPPALRAQDSKRSELEKVVRRLVNKLAESNIQAINAEILDLFREHSKTEMVDVLGSMACGAVRDEVQTLGTLVTCVAALFVALHVQLGNDIGAMLLEKVAREFVAVYEADKSKPSSNMLLLMVHMYNMEMLKHGFVFDLLRKFVASFRTLDVELTLLVLQNCGYSLRRVDARSLKEVLIQIGSKAKTATLDQGESAARFQTMLDLIFDLKNNRNRHAADATQFLAPLKGWLKNVLLRTPSRSTGDFSLNLSWNDLMNVDKLGRWWLVGSSWKGNSAEISTKQQAEEAQEDDPIEKKENSFLLELAKRMQMNTELKRRVFLLVMTSEDFLDACDKISKLNLKKGQDREVARVIIDCCGQEKSYNPFFTLIANRLCSQDRDYKFTFQLAFWDVFKLLEASVPRESQMPPRRASNLARMAADMTVARALSLVALKAVDFTSLSANGDFFFVSYFSRLFGQGSSDVLVNLFLGIAQKLEYEALRDGLAWFFKKRFAAHIESLSDEKEASLFRERLALARRYMK